MVWFNSLPNNKFWDWSKLKALADEKLNVTEKLKYVLGRVENIVGKGENAGSQHFLQFPPRFQKASFKGSLKSLDCVVKSKIYMHFKSCSAFLATVEPEI